MDINYFKAALSHHSKGNWNKAQEIYQHLLKEDPNNYEVLQNYGPLLVGRISILPLVQQFR